jgi:hypothetical protein
VSPKEVKKEKKKLVYEKPVLIGLGDTLNLGAGACNGGSTNTSGDCTNGTTANVGKCKKGTVASTGCQSGTST